MSLNADILALSSTSNKQDKKEKNELTDDKLVEQEKFSRSYQQRIYVVPFDENGMPLPYAKRKGRGSDKPLLYDYPKLYFSVQDLGLDKWQLRFLRLNATKSRRGDWSKPYLTPNHIMLIGFVALSDISRKSSVNIKELADLLVKDVDGNINPRIKTFNELCESKVGELHSFFIHCFFAGIKVLSYLLYALHTSHQNNDVFYFALIKHNLLCLMVDTLPKLENVFNLSETPPKSANIEGYSLSTSEAGELVILVDGENQPNPT